MGLSTRAMPSTADAAQSMLGRLAAGPLTPRCPWARPSSARQHPAVFPPAPPARAPRAVEREQMSTATPAAAAAAAPLMGGETGSPACPLAACARYTGEEAASTLSPHYTDVLAGPWPSEPWRLPLVYHPKYNVSAGGVEKLHPFDACKFDKVIKALKERGHLDPKGRQLVAPKDLGREALLDVHTQEYIDEVHSSNFRVAQVTELAPIVILPRWLVQWRVVTPMRYHVAGTMAAAALALEKGWAINLGGGMHHAYSSNGMGWCMFADIMLAIRRLRVATGGKVKKVLYLDLDAHQGNGVERDKLSLSDQDVYIVDLYNGGIFPRDDEAKPAIDVDVPLRTGTGTEAYLAALRGALQRVEEAGLRPDLVFYNAGTDILEGDPLGRFAVSEAGIQERDELVWRFALQLGAPIVMVLSGGYARGNAQVVAASLDNLFTKFSLGATATQPVPVGK